MPLRILLLEDTDDDADLILRELRKEGLEFTVQRVETESDFQRQLREFAPDLILADYSLPHYDGVAALAVAREVCPTVPFIFVSGTMGEETAVEALQHGATDYVLKQRLGRLGPAVRRALREAELATERQQTQERLQLQSAALAAAANGIVITDRAGIIEWINPAFTALAGYSAAEAIGKTHGQLVKSGKHDAAFYRNLWETILAGQVWRGEIINRRKDGSFYTDDQTISSLRNERGEITHFIGIKQDVTSKKSLEAQLLRAQRLESIGSLASGIAHDLNNVLSPILMCVPLLRTEADEEERRQMLGTIESSVQRSVGIVKQLLRFGRGGEEVQAPLQPRHLVRDMARIARETFPRNITICEEIPHDLWLVKANATQLHQVLLNLCVNARDAMLAGGTLTLRGQNILLDDHFASMHPEAKPGPYILLQVLDTGTGMPAEIRTRIFDPFFTTKDLDRGTGLGLTTTLGIIKNHGGLIVVQSEVNHGTQFDIYLPATSDSQIETPDSLTALPVPRGRGELILVVDDEPAIRQAVERTLCQHGYEVMTAADGIEAVSLFASHSKKIRVLITDLMMPLMDGAALCRVVRKINPDARIIVFTGIGSSPDSEAALATLAKLKIDRILSKPHTGEVLLRAVHAVLGEK
jgi:PAS domain S-box-containing protein